MLINERIIITFNIEKNKKNKINFFKVFYKILLLTSYLINHSFLIKLKYKYYVDQSLMITVTE